MINAGFMRLQNPDSTADVICLDCFKVVAHSENQLDLAAAESDHVCNPCDLVLLRYGSSNGVQRTAENAVANGMSRG
jgi:hypothetical protein